ncbi:CRAL-TRIO domain-containing protein [Aspergillus ambiguus]|uniref:CRAL-TRIO domain-containing protein n=1 Tax=Aspergillus ambiguus TaxID=176160 RepID=UPI003CCCE9B6
MTAVQITPGHLGNLSNDQNEKLKRMWHLVLDMLEPILNSSSQSTEHGSAYTSRLAQALQQTNLSRSEQKALRDALTDVSATDILAGLLSMMKQESPDRFLLRFLQTRKWDVSKAFAMLVNALMWRNKHINVDDNIIANTELKALQESKDTSDPQRAKLSEAFLEQLRIGKCFIHGTDRIGRPILVLQGRLHKSTEKSNEYAAAKFLIECAQTAYPEILGVMLIHNAPWAFSGIWKTMKRWIEPDLASRIHFTYTTEEIEKFIAPERLVKSLNGKEDWTFQFVEPADGENDRMGDTATRDKLISERNTVGEELLAATSEWIGASDADAVTRRREELIGKLQANYWNLDPYVRGRTYLDRTGIIGHGGVIDFYPCASQ